MTAFVGQHRIVAEGDTRAGRDQAAEGREIEVEAQAAGIFRRVGDDLGIDETVAVFVEEIIRRRVEVAEIAREPEPLRARRGPIEFHFDTLHGRAAGIEEVAEEGVLGAVAIRVVGGEGRHLDVLVLTVENRGVEDQAAVGEHRLDAKLHHVEHFVVERFGRLRENRGLRPHVVAAAFEAARQRHITHDVVADLVVEAELRRHRRKGLGFVEVRGGGRHLAEGRIAEALVEGLGIFVFFGGAQAEVEAQAIVHLVAAITEEGDRIGAGITVGGAEHTVEEDVFHQTTGFTIEVVGAKNAVPLLARVDQLEFLRDLLVVVGRDHVGDAGRGGVEVDVVFGIRLAVGRNRLELPGVVHIPGDGHGGALAVGAVQRLETTAGIEDVGFRRAGRAEEKRAEAVGFEPGEALGFGFVFGAIEIELHLDAVGGQPVEGQAEGLGIAVGDLAAGEEVFAVAVVAEGAERHLGAQFAFDQRAAHTHLDVLVAVAAGSQGDEAGGFVGQRLADVFDGATDGVFTVERALRTAQHFDTADIEQVEQGTLRTGVINVVEVEAHTRIHTPERVGLTDTAQEHGECGRLATARVDRQVGHFGLQLRKIRCRGFFQRFAGHHGDGDRHLLQVFGAFAGGDGDLFTDFR